MNKLGTVTLETPRLLLRRFVPEDAEAMFRNWANDPEVTKFLTWQTHQSVQDSQEVIARWIGQYGDSTRFHWAIVLRELGEPIGSITGEKANEETGTITVGYCIGKRWWGQGLTAEALRAVLEFLLKREGYECVKACHDPNNPNSGKVMRKCGMRYEGTWRRCMTSNQGVCDGAWYSILRSELRPEASGEPEGAIRRAASRDIPRIMDLLVQVCMVHHNGRPDIFKGPATKYTVPELEKILQDDKTPVFVLTDENDVLRGYCFCILQQILNDNVRTDIKTLYIDDLCVDETSRGRHVGKRLLEYVTQYARSIGCYNVTLNVWSCNESAMRFYFGQGMAPQKVGMEIIL